MIRSVAIAAPSFGGGGMIRVYYLAELLQHLGIAVRIVAHLPAGRPLYPAVPPGLDLITVAGRRIWHYAPQYLRALRGEVILAVKPRTSSFGLALLAGRLSRRPVLLDVDDWELSYRIGSRLAQWKLAALERLLRAADAITVNNLALQARFGGTLLPSAQDAQCFDPSRHDAAACRRALGLQDRFVLMFPGTAVPHSGLEDLLLALDMLGRAEPILVVVGGRASGRVYVKERLARWSARILHLPEYPRAEIPAVVASAHLFVVPHRNLITARYNFPMKLIDGMAMGKPILATRVGDMERALGEAAYLVTPAAPAEIAAVLQQVLDHPEEAARRGRLARARFEQDYSYAAVAPILARVLAGLEKS